MGGLMVFAFLWGLAEATFFFIIPDVVLTFIALHGFRGGLNASLLALLGALTGGAVMYRWAVKDPSAADRFVRRVPAIHGKMMADVEMSLRERGVIAMILGPIRGIPYKVYAIYGSRANIGFVKFLLASIPARFVRFFLTSIVAWVLADVVFKALDMWIKYTVWAIVWIIVYSIYFKIHPWKGDR